ncbi:MAG: hypothetical protein NT062_06615 [Proteobacteria bacterium]|nr:hypothetical protein [Pseudomonadota bacterium]
MKIMKFEGATMREALSKVKAELGDDAVIVSTRQIRRGLLGATGCEISAAIDDEADAAPPPSLRSRYAASAPAPTPQVTEDVDKIRGELRSLRALVRSSTDNRELRNEVAELRKLVENLRVPTPAPAPRAPAFQQATQFTPPPVAKPPTPLVAPSRGRILMLVGPTGAGKTTTIAKLAAQAALIEQRSVNIITLDNYRVGGVDQIRTFADLIGVPLQVVGSISELGEVLEQGDHELTLIDTAGRSPLQAAAVIDELAAALPSLPAIEIHLVAPAASTPTQLDELARRHAPLHPTRLLVTKLDEVIGELPDLLAAPGRLGLSITWVTTGQAVPEDLESPTTVRLLDLASGVLGKRAAA